MPQPGGSGCKEGAASPWSSIAVEVRHRKVPGGLGDLTSPSEMQGEGHGHRRKQCWGGTVAGSSTRRVGVDGA